MASSCILIYKFEFTTPILQLHSFKVRCPYYIHPVYVDMCNGYLTLEKKGVLVKKHHDPLFDYAYNYL